MRERVDPEVFQAEVENWLRNLQLPGKEVEARFGQRFREEPPFEEIGPLYIDEPRPGSLSGRSESRQMSQEDWHSRLRREVQSFEEFLLRELQRLEPEKGWKEMQDSLKATPEEVGHLWEQWRLANESKAKDLTVKKAILSHLCPALMTASSDALEISKITTPILIGLSVAGTVTIPLVPALFAAVALVVSRMGIASLCHDYQK